MREFVKYPAYLMLLITQECNLDCVYCYLKNSRSSGCMEKNLITKAVKTLARSNIERVHIQITGGEPTIYPELLEYTLKNIRSTVSHASIGLQTNCTLMDKSLVKMFEKYSVQVGVSIDGLGDVHNKFRGKFEDTLRGLKLLDESEVNFRVTCVVYKNNIYELDRLLLFLANFRNFRGINLDLITKKNGINSCPERANPEELREGLVKFLKTLKWINLSRSVPIAFRQHEMLFKETKLKCPVMEFQSIALCTDGSVYPCTHLVGDKRFYCGLIDNIDYSPFKFLSSFVADYGCVNGKCSIFMGCPGECPARLYYNAKDFADHTENNLSCLLYKTIWNHCENN